MSESNGKLSSRVMNMKFMRHTGATEEQPQEEQKVVKDASKWNSSARMPHKKVMVKKPRHLIKSNMGITQLKGIPQGRRRFEGEKKENEKKKEQEQEKEDDYDLDRIFKQVKVKEKSK